MYHPYFRGKQFELITIRETARLLAESNFVPIIEPVKESLGGLEKTLKEVCDAGGKAIIIVNPYHGEHRENGDRITQLLDKNYLNNNSINSGLLLRNDMSLHEAINYYDVHKNNNPTIIHSGFMSPKELSSYFGDEINKTTNVFVENKAKILYRKNFEGSKRILLRDGFNRCRNADYPPLEEFSDLHVTYSELGMVGFGDFLIVGDHYAESGGPAYAVAIHLTFIDPDKDNVMYIYHFVSDSRDTPTDPAGKFAQALDKLVKKLDSGTSNLLETNAVKEFRELHAKGHFPGLGYVKKLSMKHHIETLADYFS